MRYAAKNGLDLAGANIRIEPIERGLPVQQRGWTPEPGAGLGRIAERGFCFADHAQKAPEPVGLLRRQRPQDAAVSRSLSRQHETIELREGNFPGTDGSIYNVQRETLPGRQ